MTITRHIHGRPVATRRSRRWSPAGCMLLLLAAPVTAQDASPAAPPVDQESVETTVEPSAPEARLLDPTLEPSVRREAASEIVRIGQFDAVIAALDAGPDAAGAAALIDAIRTDSRRDEGTLRALAAAVRAAPDDAVRRALEILRESRSRTAVRATLELFTGERADDVRTAAQQTLVLQTGMDDLGDDADAWTTWWAEVEWLTEPEWRARLAAAHSARGERLQRQRDALAGRLTDTYRRLYAALPPDERSTLLAELIADDRDELRVLGLDLAERAMLNARPLTADALAAAIERMIDDDPEVRTRAARVVARAAPQNAGEAAARALANERDPSAASAQLGILARFPQRQAADASMRWLDDASGAGGTAADALSALARAGMLDAPAARAQAIERLRSIEPAFWAAGHVRLIDSVGVATDLDQLAANLTSFESIDTREAAVVALARRPGREAALVVALRAEPVLLDAVARGLGARLAPSEGLRTLREVAQNAGATQDLSLHEDALISMMPPDDAVAAIAALSEATRRLALLEALAARADAPDTALLALARERLRAADGAGASGALDRLRDPSAPAAQRTRLLVLAWSNDLERAADLNAPPDAWLEAFSLVDRAGLAHAGSIAAVALELHRESFTDVERLRLERASPGVEAGDPTTDASSPTKSSGGPGDEAAPAKSGL